MSKGEVGQDFDVKQKSEPLPTSENKKNSSLKKQIALRITGIVALMSTPAICDIHEINFIDQNHNYPYSINFSTNELGQLQETVKEINQERHCLFISGGMGTYANIRGIKEGLGNQYGVGKVEIFNSVLNFEDPQNPQRFEKMADVIQSYSRKGLDIITHSLGAVELQKAIEIVKKRDEKFFDRKENAENLHIILISPSGFSEGIEGPFKFLIRVIAKEQSNRGEKSPYVGIDALTAFPPEGILSKDLEIALRKTMPELSQLKNNQSVKTIPLQKEQNYSDKLSDSEKEQIKIYSSMMKTAIADENYDGFRYLVIRYGEVLKKPLSEAYEGNFEPTPAPVIEAIQSTVGGYIGLMNILIDAFGSKPMKEIAKLQTKGVCVDFIVPEYDIMLPLDEAIKFFNGPGEADKHIKVAAGMTHAFLALHKMSFGKMVKNFQGDNFP